MRGYRESPVQVLQESGQGLEVTLELSFEGEMKLPQKNTEGKRKVMPGGGDSLSKGLRVGNCRMHLGEMLSGLGGGW